MRAYAAILDELRVRGICRTSNNPVADYSEWLVASRLGLDLCKSSSKGFDATGPEGVKYQIKARRVTASNASVQLGAIRGLDCRQFDYMVAVLFESDFSIRYALKIPHEVVVEQSKFRAHTNAHIFHLRRTLIDHPKVEQVTERLR